MLGDGSIHEMDHVDVALLLQRTELNVPDVYSKDVFRRFTAFVRRQELDLDKKVIDQWNDNFMEEIMDTDTLHDLIMLACRTGQVKLLDVCSKRLADVLKARRAEEVAELLNLPHMASDDEDEDEGGDGDNDLQPEVPGGANDGMDNDLQVIGGP